VSYIIAKTVNVTIKMLPEILSYTGEKFNAIIQFRFCFEKPNLQRRGSF